jgi:hypothetical protein
LTASAYPVVSAKPVRPRHEHCRFRCVAGILSGGEGQRGRREGSDEASRQTGNQEIFLKQPDKHVTAKIMSEVVQ